MSLQNILARNIGTKMNTNRMKALITDHVTPLLAGDDDLSLAGKVSKDAIDSLTRQIAAIEVVVENKIELKKPYDLLSTMPGVGRVLALTIMMETGPIDRFADVGNYVSYCRKVPAARFSNDKKRGQITGRTATSICPGHLPRPESLRGGLTLKQELIMPGNEGGQTHRLRIVHWHTSWPRAAFYITRDGVPFMPEKAFE